MISQQKVDALCLQLEALYIPDGPLHTEHGARYHVRRSIIGMFKDTSLGSYEHITYLVRSIGLDCGVQAVNDRQKPDVRAEYVAQAKAWEEFDPMVQALWYHKNEVEAS